jgi:hypothetical protein
MSDLPIGVEDASGGFVDNATLVAGFGLGNLTDGCFLANCSTSHDEACWSRPGALLNVNTYHGNPCHGAWFSRVYAITVAEEPDSDSATATGGGSHNTAQQQHQWSELPLPPLAPRQGACGVADPSTGSFYVAGGWSEWAPFPCGHTDAARLQRGADGEWKWTKLPDLPHPVVFGGMTVANGSIFVFGADRYAFAKHTSPPPACGTVPPMLFELDTALLRNPADEAGAAAAGWITHAFPFEHGTVSEIGGAMATAGNSIFLLDGGNLESYEAGGNFRFDLITRAWSRLDGSPVHQLSAFHNSNNAILHDRYVILIGGCEIWNWKKGTAPKGREQCYTGSPGFGTCGCPCSKSSNGTKQGDIRNVSAIAPGTCGVPLNDSSLPMVYGNGLFVYDTHLGIFGTATVSAVHDPELLPRGQGCGPFPFNVANPMVTVSGSQVAVVGGEINTRQIGQTLYQHDSQSALLGEVTVLPLKSDSIG